MKSEERRQLLTNDLGVVTTKTVSFFEQHIGTLIGLVCGALLLAGLGFWWMRPAGIENAEGWSMLEIAQDLEDFGEVVDKFKGKPPGQWAQLRIAETTLKTGLPLMFSNREIAVVDLKRARDDFETLLQDKTVGSEIRERALWGFALCLETLCEGDTAKVVEAFERLISDYPDSIFKSVAEDRIASLKKPGAKEFYAWFSKEAPKPPDARPRDFKTEDGINIPAPKGADDDGDGDDQGDAKPIGKEATEKAPIDTKEKVQATPPVGDNAEKVAHPTGKPAVEEKAAEPAKPVDGEKPGDSKPDKNE